VAPPAETDATAAARPADADPAAVARAVEAFLAGLDPGARVLVAASGGPDSTALLHAAAAAAPGCGAVIVAAHVDHGLRPEAAGEAAHVRALAADAGVVEFHALRGDARAEARRVRSSCQDGARVLRYRLLAVLATEAHCGAVATAHTADDQAETLLLRLLRGAGLAGLAGILPERALAPGVRLVRPLLDVTRAEVQAYVRDRGLAARTLADPSNRDPRYARTRVRAALLPLLVRENPGAVRQLAALAADARAAAALLDAQASTRLAAAAAGQGGAAGAFAVAAVAAADEALRPFVLRAALRAAGGEARRLERVHVAAALRLCATTHGTAEVAWPGGFVLRRTYDRLEVLPPASRRPALDPHGEDLAAASTPAAPLAPAPVAMHAPGRAELPWADAAHRFVRVEPCEPAAAALRARFPLVLRPRRRGDRICLAGRSGTRRLQDLFVDARIPRADRARLPLVCAGPDGAEVLFIPGFGAAVAADPGAAAHEGAPALRVEFSPE
jgi:tRNA(Ile)-lysidine synthase